MGNGWKSVLTVKKVYKANKKHRQGLEGNAAASNVLDMLITNYAHLFVLKQVLSGIYVS